MTDQPPVNRRNPYGRMEVLATDQFRIRLYRCPCGWQGWACWGNARKHAERCPEAVPR